MNKPRQHLTLRWVFDKPSPRKIMLGVREIYPAELMCRNDGCNNRFPEQREFFVFDGASVCLPCVRATFDLPDDKEPAHD